MTELLWARLKADLRCGLRRGAWYRVIRRTLGDAILDVDHRPLTVPGDCLELTSGRPERWTIVERPGEEAGLATLWGTSYAVCPSCSHRTPVLHPGAEARCTNCGGPLLEVWARVPRRLAHVRADARRRPPALDDIPTSGRSLFAFLPPGSPAGRDDAHEVYGILTSGRFFGCDN